MIKYLLRELAGIVSMLRNIKILTALLFLINTANAQTVSPPTCSINGATITCPNGSLIPGGVPGGSNTQIQFNDSGAFGGSSLFTFNKTTGQISNNQGTLTTSSPFTVTQTWNNAATTFTGIQANVIDTASASASLLMDLQVGGVSQFSINKSGTATAVQMVTSGSNQVGAASGYIWAGRSQLRSPADGQITLFNNAQTGFTRLNFGGTTSSFPALKAAGTQIQVRTADDVSFGTFAAANISLTASGTAVLSTDAADTLAQRNGTNAQTFRVYNTYTDASNYRRAAANTNSAYVEFAAESAGASAANMDVRLTPSGTGLVNLPGGATLLTTRATLTNGAAAEVGTLTNAPVAGNPTKWIAINDNGTTRYIPAW